MRRSIIRLATATAPSRVRLSSAAVTEPKTSMQPMHAHVRSSHAYEASAKGAEVGARNEAAFMNYELVRKLDLGGLFAIPHFVNLLTITPLYCAALAVGCWTWGLFYWDLYCRSHYETVLIARPEALK
ncbi:uncharacterized protein TEOVI_000886500 [Trypanosoma equiperdum]|uniref:Succinate dehydrogenase subunit n=2 Tax=Trypanozoon TaxID=39700 RepID=Q57VW2_TRYB2|nr:hypothetical protein, conserved [Trypanosoma brucei brucei TREU927]AAX70252.1 hypothetical protein, conserved [Trypanosoma brucei]AAZ11166.1 hypothetical protein, conserved [Trypanosoma brucei brucei TREU927]SCU64471.1 hypothetical protein, conserved [Trypanosoma equiperdum]